MWITISFLSKMIVTELVLKPICANPELCSLLEQDQFNSETFASAIANITYTMLTFRDPRVAIVRYANIIMKPVSKIIHKEQTICQTLLIVDKK